MAAAVKYDRNGAGTYIRIDEKDAGPASEVELNLPAKGVITALRCTLVSGSGSTVLPTAGSRAGFAPDGQHQVYRGPNNNTPAVHINEQQPVRYRVPGGRMFHRSGVDAGADNVIVTEYFIGPGLAQ